MNTRTPLKQEIMSGKTIAGAMVFEFFSPGSQCTQWKTEPDSHATPVTPPPPLLGGREVGGPWR